MNRPLAMAVLLALAAATGAHADTLTLQVGNRVDTHAGVVVQVQQANVLARIDFGSTGYTSRTTKEPAPFGIGHWTVVINGTSYGDCELVSTRYTGAARALDVTFWCAP